MSNPSPNLENLALGRGKRPKTDNLTVSMRMSPLTRKVLEDVARSYNCMYGGEPWIAGLLEKIGKKELQIVPTPPQVQEEAKLSDPKKSLKLDVKRPSRGLNP